MELNTQRRGADDGTAAPSCRGSKWTEEERVAALMRYRILDTPTEPLFDDIAKLASEVCETPIGVVNFIGEDRQWFKSEVGIGQRELPLDVSICRHAILQQGLFVVPDLSLDTRFTNNPLVEASDGLRFYAGALLKTPEGLPIGTVCVLDTKPRPDGLAEIEARTLKTLARQVMSELELRRALADRDREVERSHATEALLKDSETRLQLALRAARAVAWQWDFSTETIRWGDVEAIRELAGPEMSQTVSFKAWLERIHPDDVERHVSEGTAAVQAGHGTVTFRLLRNGEVRWLQAVGRVTSHTPAGEPLAMTGITQDITERTLAEQSVRENEERLRIAMAAGSLGEWDWNVSTDVVTFSEQGAALFGIEAGPSITWTDLQHLIEQTDAKAAAQAVADSLASGRDYLFEYRVNRRDGRKVWVNAVGRPVFDQGQAVRMIGTVQDITARREAEEALKDLNQTLEERVSAEVAERRRAEEALIQSRKLESMGQLTGGVAHDFNNLLTPIIGSLDLLQRRRFGDERVQRHIDGALQSAERAKTLVQSLLAFARRQPLQATSIDLEKSICGMSDLVASTVGPRIRLQIELNTDLPPICADQNQLEMALLNLTINARDAMPLGGTLRIAASVRTAAGGRPPGLQDGKYVLLAVADTGQGMDEATLARAIEPFFSTKGVGRGTGLGLSMVHGLAAQLGGALTIQSRLGEGTSVQLWLPVANELPHELSNSGALKRPRAAGLALVVDDEDLVRASIAGMIEELGYKVVELSSAEEALTELRKGLPAAVVVTDHLMPNMTGTELASTLSQERPSLPVLIVSGYADDAGINSAFARLTKPFRQADLALKLSELVSC